MEIREIRIEELSQLLELYHHLHKDGWLDPGPQAQALWETIGKMPGYHILVAEEEGRLLSSCTLLLVPNLTHDGRPYGVIENVVTHPDHRCKGLASGCLALAKRLAQEKNCYKLMLMTGSKRQSTLHFYEQAGYRSDEKTAFVQWL